MGINSMVVGLVDISSEKLKVLNSRMGLYILALILLLLLLGALFFLKFHWDWCRWYYERAEIFGDFLEIKMETLIWLAVKMGGSGRFCVRCRGLCDYRP